jgi:hypothetical protein
MREAPLWCQGESHLSAAIHNVLLCCGYRRWGRAQEVYGEDPIHMGELVTAFVTGAQVCQYRHPSL